MSIFTAYLALYFLFAGQFSLGEALAGLACAVLAECFSVVLHRDEGWQIRLAAPWPRLACQTLLSFVVDTGRVARVLLGTVRHRPPGAVGSVSGQSFDRGIGLPRDAGRRALVTLCSSLAPNGYVIDVSDTDDAIMLHRLAPAPVRPDRQWPV